MAKSTIDVRRGGSGLRQPVGRPLDFSGLGSLYTNTVRERDRRALTAEKLAEIAADRQAKETVNQFRQNIDPTAGAGKIAKLAGQAGDFQTANLYSNLAAADATKDFRKRQLDLTKRGQDISAGKSGQSTFGLTPVYGTDENGNPVIMQMNNRGGVQRVDVPEGVTPSTGIQRVDTGTEILVIDNKTGKVMDVLPKNIADEKAQEEIGKATGKAQGEAIVSLPKAIGSAETMISLIDELAAHPGKKNSLGLGSLNPLNQIPGSPEVDFEARRQQIADKTFLQGFQELKGAGAITATEGAKGEGAIARLKTAQSEAAFDQALKELQDVVRNGVKRMQAQAERGPTDRDSRVPATTRAPGGAVVPKGTTSSGIPWSVE